MRKTSVQNNTINNTGEGMFDPVCGMNLKGIDEFKKIQLAEKGLFFCSDHCKSRFEKNPEKFQNEPLIKLRNVQKVFNLGGVDTYALKDLDIYIWEGDFVAIIGASGSGKSTALNMIGLLDKPTSGDIFLKGVNISDLNDEEKTKFRSETFGFIFQQYNLIPWLTAFENISLPLIFSGKGINNKKINASIEGIGLGGRSLHRPFELSGGEQQRVALLRALVSDPDIILGDEPTGNLDSSTGNKLLDILLDLNKKEGKTLLIVTHDADIAGKADQIITMKDGKAIKDHQVYKKIYTE